MHDVRVIQLNGVELGWMPGMMINTTNIVPVPSNTSSLSLPVFIVLVILFMAFLIISVAFFCHACKRRRRVYEVSSALFYISFTGSETVISFLRLCQRPTSHRKHSVYGLSVCLSVCDQLIIHQKLVNTISYKPLVW